MEYLVAVLSFGLIYLLLTIGLNLQYGSTGLVNFGHVGFYAVGAYTSALATLRLGLPTPAGLALAAAVAAIPAIPLGLLSLRLRDDYLAIVTLGFAEFVRLVATNEQWLTRGVQGIPGIRPLFDGWLSGQAQTAAVLAVLLALNVAVAWTLRRLMGSPFGRVITAIRDDEVALKALGKDPTWFKVQVFAIGAALAGLAGGLQAHYLTFISPEQFVSVITFYVWMAMLMGGAGRLTGSVVGAGVLVALLEGSRFLRDFLPGVSEVQMANLRLLVIGVAIVLVVRYRPQGLFGSYSK
jgi:branched-chain amino acid transport system permease protein